MADKYHDPMCRLPVPPSEPALPRFSAASYFEPAEIAQRLNLKAQRSNGQAEWHGSNPTGIGAEKDGFFIRSDGTAYDRKLRQNYGCFDVARMAGIKPEEYGPCVRWKEQKDGLNPVSSFNSFNSSPADVSDGVQDPDDFTWRGHNRSSQRKSHPKVSGKVPVPSTQSPIALPAIVAVPAFLSLRGISLRTSQKFEIAVEMYIDSERGCWYPTYHADGAPGPRRWKNCDSDRNPKYRWDSNKGNTQSDQMLRPVGYGLNFVHDHQVVFVVGGEVDVWTANEAGIPAVAQFGENMPYTGLMAALKDMGVEKVIIILDNDETGHRGSVKAMCAAQETGLEWEVRDIGGPAKNDWNTLYHQLEFDTERLRKQVEQLPVVNAEQLVAWEGRKNLSLDNAESLTTGFDNELNGINEVSLGVSQIIGNIESTGPATAAYQIPFPEKALYGVAGEFVRLAAPQSEAHPMAILIQLLVSFATLIGGGAFFRAEKTVHALRLYAIVIGQSAKGRKGTSWGWVRWLLEQVDPEFIISKITNGLSTGEGLVFRVRDPIIERQRRKEDSGEVSYEEVIVDEGIEDKRLLVVEDEIASVLKMLEREGNSLSPVLRTLWDSGTTGFETKSNKVRTTNSHIGIIGHGVADEVTRLLSSNDATNGFSNRFLWVHVYRTQLLPEGGQLDESACAPIVERLQEAARFGQAVGELRRDAAATALWSEIYTELADEMPGLAGKILGRGEPQVMRLACVYAVLDSSEVVRVEHLEAAFAIWKYVEATVVYLFGGRTGNPVVDKLLKSLQKAGDNGLPMTEIHQIFGKNVSGATLRGALEKLKQQGVVDLHRIDTGGRPTERWVALPSPAHK